MRTITALRFTVLLAACHCILAYDHSHTPRQIIKETIHALLGEKSKSVSRIVSCTESLGLSKCFSALAVWRADRALKVFNENSMNRFNLTEDVEKFPWKEYANITNEDLQIQLLDCTQKLLQYQPLTFDVSGYSAKLQSKGNNSVSIDIQKADEFEGRGSMKKLQKQFYKYVPFLMAPGLFLSAILPFALPSLKMMVMMVGMMNNMALVSAIFTLLRNNAFNDKYQHRVIYTNNGYKNEKLRHASSDNEEHIHTDHIGILYDDHTHLPEKPSPHFVDNYGNIEELPTLSVSPEWIKEFTNQKIISMRRKETNDDNNYNRKMNKV